MAAERSEASPDSAGFGFPQPVSSWLRRWMRGPVVTTVTLAAVGGFLLTAAVLTGRDAAGARHSRHDELVALVEARQERVEALEAQLDAVRRRLSEVEEAAEPAGGLRAQVREAEQAAGLSALVGPGVRIRLDDADSDCPTGDPADCRIRDRDLQAAVNTLFAAGAEAVAVNEERIVATSAIRNAGSAVLVNYRVLGPPYEVAAIGDPDTLVADVRRSELARDFAVWTDRYGLGFDLEAVDELVLPAYAGSVRTREAQVVPDDRDPVGPVGEEDRS